MGSSRAPHVHRGLTTPRLKTFVFALEALNALSTTYYFYDIYFYTKAQFGFGALQNLTLAAVVGAIYAVSAFYGGKFAQRFGYFTSIRAGAVAMAILFLVGSQIKGLAGTLAIMILSNIALCLTWPAMQGLMSEGEPPERLQGLVGVYNFIWAAAGAVAYFAGGFMLQSWGPKSIYYVPAAILIVEAFFVTRLEREAMKEPVAAPVVAAPRPAPEGNASPVPSTTFLKMAWVANPLAYLAINTVIPTIPSLAAHFNFSPRQAGFACSIWLFVRAVAFIVLRYWSKWHYRFRFLAGAYVAMVASFGGMLWAGNIAMLVISQIIFGVAIGLIYYSSLFYSMDIGETKGEHGGIHEAAIGLGNAGGPGLAASALAFYPEHPGSGTMAVCALLVAGLVGLYWMRYRLKS